MSKINQSLIINGTVKIYSMKLKYDWKHPFLTHTPSPTLGTGFIIEHNKTKYICTAAHVVESFKTVQIEFPTLGAAERCNGVVLGVCIEDDIAMIQLAKNVENKLVADETQWTDKTFVQVIPVGNSDTVIGASQVFAVGYPLGMTNIKISKGVVNGIQDGLFQIDASINPGNSGGPLLYDGKIVGMNISGIVPSEATSISFAVPVNRINQLLDLLVENEFTLIEKPHPGFELQNYKSTGSTGSSKVCNGNFNLGQVVQIIVDGSPADEKLQIGDVICSYSHDKKTWNDITFLGEISLSFFKDYKLSFKTDGLQRFKLGDMLYLKVSRGNNTPIVKELLLNKGNLFPGRRRYPSLENSVMDYICFGSICVMQLSVNHFEQLQLATLLSNFETEEVTKPHLIVSSLLSADNDLKLLNVLCDGDIITHVNGIAVSTLKEYKEALLQPFYVIEDENLLNQSSLNWSDVCRQHNKLEHMFVQWVTSNNKQIYRQVKEIIKKDTDLQKIYKFNYSFGQDIQKCDLLQPQFIREINLGSSNLNN